MNNEPPSKNESDFSRQVGVKETRKLAAQRRGVQSVWTGFGLFGLVGWSIVVPTVAGALIGHWLDKHHPASRSWTLALLVAGLFLGCLNAWNWVARENRRIHEDAKEDKRHE